jgi:hypothetical protein
MSSAPVATSALDQRVVEDRPIVVFAGDDGDLVPAARMVDPLVVGLRPKAFRVERGEGVRGAVHAPSAVASTDDRDELAGLLIVIRRDELDERLLRGAAA